MDRGEECGLHLVWELDFNEENQKTFIQPHSAPLYCIRAHFASLRFDAHSTWLFPNVAEFIFIIN